MEVKKSKRTERKRFTLSAVSVSIGAVSVSIGAVSVRIGGTVCLEKYSGHTSSWLTTWICTRVEAVLRSSSECTLFKCLHRKVAQSAQKEREFTVWKRISEDVTCFLNLSSRNARRTTLSPVAALYHRVHFYTSTLIIGLLGERGDTVERRLASRPPAHSVSVEIRDGGRRGRARFPGRAAAGVAVFSAVVGPSIVRLMSRRATVFPAARGGLAGVRRAGWFWWTQETNFVNQSINRSNDSPINKSTDQSINQSNNQSINQSIEKLIEQSVNQSVASGSTN